MDAAQVAVDIGQGDDFGGNAGDAGLVDGVRDVRQRGGVQVHRDVGLVARPCAAVGKMERAAGRLPEAMPSREPTDWVALDSVSEAAPV